MTITRAPDKRVGDAVETLLKLEKASLKWHWRLLAVAVALSTIIAAIFQILNYFLPQTPA